MYVYVLGGGNEDMHSGMLVMLAMPTHIDAGRWRVRAEDAVLQRGVQRDLVRVRVTYKMVFHPGPANRSIYRPIYPFIYGATALCSA